METTFNYKIFGGNAPNPPSGTYVNGDWTGLTEYNFGTGTKIILVWCHDQRMVIRFSFDGVVWGEDFELYDAPQAEPLYMSAQKFQVQNRVNGAQAIFQVMGQW